MGQQREETLLGRLEKTLLGVVRAIDLCKFLKPQSVASYVPEPKQGQSTGEFDAVFYLVIKTFKK